MCGIAGAINKNIDVSVAFNSLKHRGPNDKGSVIIDNITLVHTRLSIQDISNGKQPMSYKNRYHIVFNGEIYNHLLLREEFNLKCSTTSDTETLLHLYDKFKEKFLNILMECLPLLFMIQKKKPFF